MPLIPALISANAYYKNAKDNLAKEAENRQKLADREAKQLSAELEDIDPELNGILQKAMQMPDAGPLPEIPRSNFQYPEYVPLSKRRKSNS